jgi:hypothetical protein
MGQYLVICDRDFAKYKVRKYNVKWKLLIAYCQQEKDGEWWASNIIQTSNNYHDIIKMVRLCKELDRRHREDLIKLWKNSD